MALSAGTAAVHLALLACGVGQGDEAIVQSFTFVPSSHPGDLPGATRYLWILRLIHGTWTRFFWSRLSGTVSTRRVESPKRDCSGGFVRMPYKIDQIMSVADKYGIPVIEDAAEGFGSKFDGQVLELLANMVCFLQWQQDDNHQRWRCFDLP